MSKLSRSLPDALNKPKMTEKVNHATGLTLHKRREIVAEHYPDWEELRESASRIREEALERLPELIIRFKESVEKRGGKVWIVEKPEEIREILHTLLAPHRRKPVVKAKSMFSEELEIQEWLEERGFEVLETDLGEFIIQLLGQLPSHITAPAIHLSRHDISEIFKERINGPETTDPEMLTRHARHYLRRHFLEAGAGITGANFLLAESGSVVLLENEANIRLTTTLPETVITLAGAEKMLASASDLKPFMKLLPISATGQEANCYTSFLPVRKNHHVILMAGDRIQLLNDPVGKEIMKCIRCGACLNTCPVFRTVGGHGYGSVYSGPMGAVLTPLLDPEQSDMPFLSSLCGACTDICPVKIPLHNLLLELRGRAEKKPLESIIFSLFQGAHNPEVYNRSTKLLRSVPSTLRDLLAWRWTHTRTGFPISKRSFRELWHEREKSRETD